MTLLLHPTGNSNVRETIRVLQDSNLLDSFHTTVGLSNSETRTRFLKKILSRRCYDISKEKLKLYPYREMVRLFLNKLHLNQAIAHEKNFSIDDVSRNLSKNVAIYIREHLANKSINNIYAYEDSAFYAFEAAKENGIKCIYELPIVYWKYMHQLLNEEIERLPAWRPTFVFAKDSSEKLERKEREIDLADTICCPSDFVYNSLPKSIRESKNCVVNRYAAPEVTVPPLINNCNKTVKFIFVGSMSQRKGLADLLEAFKKIKRTDVELTIIGSPFMPMSFYYSIYPQFKHIHSCSNTEVLQVMRSCDVFILPSIVEGRALVQLEALSMGLPLIITPNTGGSDLVEDGKTGFIIPIRSPEAICEKVNWFADNKENLYDMKKYVQNYARTINWSAFMNKILEIVK